MKNKIKLVLIAMLCFTLTGCTKYIKDENNQIIKNNETGQNLTQNILCLPKDEEILNIYKEYNKNAPEKEKVDLENLESCDVITPLSGEYEGIWTTLFVKPLAWLIIKIGMFLKSYGLGLIVSTLLIRLVMYPFTKKQAMQSENMKKANPEIKKIEKKYENRNDQESMMQKSTELLSVYKKYDINPVSGCLFSFIQIPLFFAFYEAITRIPVIFEENFLGIFQLGTSPAVAVFMSGKWYYIIWIFLIAGATYYSFKLNSGASMNEEQAKQMKTMSNIMVVFMTIAAFSISTGIAIYWTVSNTFTIVQNLLVKVGKKNDKYNTSRGKK